MRIWLRSQIVRACWAILGWLEASCPVCASAVDPTQATKACDVCGQPVLGSVLRQHDGRILCVRHKAGV